MPIPHCGAVGVSHWPEGCRESLDSDDYSGRDERSHVLSQSGVAVQGSQNVQCMHCRRQRLRLSVTAVGVRGSDCCDVVVGGLVGGVWWYCGCG